MYSRCIYSSFIPSKITITRSLTPLFTYLLTNLLMLGLKQGRDSNTCNEYIPDSDAIRKEISKLTKQRFGNSIDPIKPYGLYPYLELPDFMKRQEAFGEMISMRNNSFNIIDIGAYYNPIHLFLAPNQCPHSVIIVEPILDALSAIVPCPKQYTRDDNPHKSTHYIILPITFKYFITIKQMLPKPGRFTLSVPYIIVT